MTLPHSLKPSPDTDLRLTIDGRWIVAAIAWLGLCIWGHLPFSIWLVSQRSSLGGGWAFKDAVPAVSVMAAAALLAWLWHRSRQAHARRRRQVWLWWAVWLACCAGVDRWLTFSVNEYAHYPQYALLAVLLARGLDARRQHWPVVTVVLLTTMLGAIDETLQYLWTTRSYSHYLDFNDWLVNLLAAWAGVMLYYGFDDPPRHSASAGLLGWHRWRTKGLGLGLAVLLTAAFMAWAGQRITVTPGPDVSVPAGGLQEGTLYLQRAPHWYNHWQDGPRHGRYWVLHPAAGLGLMALALVLVRRFRTM